jgi:hypothetical protein
MRTLAASLAVIALLGALAAVPAGAAQRSEPEPVARAAGVPIGFVTRPLIRRTLEAARVVRLSYVRYRALREELTVLDEFFYQYRARQRARKYCQAFQAAFGYPRHYYFVGNTVVSYAYDACSGY